MARDKWFHRLRSPFTSTAKPTTTATTTTKTSPASKLISSIIYHRSHSTNSTSTISSSSSSIGVLAFEVAGMVSKLVALHASLSDKSIIRLKNDCIALDGVRKIVSNDDDFLLGLACAEMLKSLRHLANSVATNLSHRCRDPNLRCFLEVFHDFAERGRDPHNWVLTTKELDSLTRKLDRQITATSLLYREMEELAHLESSLHRKFSKQQPPETTHPFSFLRAGSDHHHHINNNNTLEIQQKIVWQKQEVKHARDKSLWTRSFDSVTLSLARLIFTVLGRIKSVFGIGHGFVAAATSLPRSLSSNSAVVFPSQEFYDGGATEFISGPIRMRKMTTTTRDLVDDRKRGEVEYCSGGGSGGGRCDGEFFESNTNVLNPPSGTLGASALSLHYANLIIVIEKMVKSPQLVGLDARDDLYSMLPNSIRSSLRSRLRGVGFSATDPGLAGEWRDALGRILGWLGPLAHNMIKWQSERSFEQQQNRQHLRGVNRANHVFLLQTLFFANKEKTEAAITELLVGLNYIWRFDREMNAKALFECSNFLHLQQQASSYSC